MPDLFDHAMQERINAEAPLAARMRPRTLDEFVGQEQIVGLGKLLPLTGEQTRKILDMALTDKERGYGKRQVIHFAGCFRRNVQ